MQSSFADFGLSSSSQNESEEDCICGPESCKAGPRLSIDSNSSEDEVDFVNVSLWENIVRQSKEKLAPYRGWLGEQKALEPVVPPQNGAAEFLEREIFPLLLPAMRTMLMQAYEWEALDVQKCRFNGLDFLAEILWNRNPRYPKRSQNWRDLFSIPPFRLWLKLHPRPIFPKSWLWSKEEGALIIQKWVRGWLVRKQEDVQEMRMFWKTIIAETEEEAAELSVTYSELMQERKEKETARLYQRRENQSLERSTSRCLIENRKRNNE